jgi:hypothetical protein
MLLINCNFVFSNASALARYRVRLNVLVMLSAYVHFISVIGAIEMLSCMYICICKTKELEQYK